MTPEHFKSLLAGYRSGALSVMEKEQLMRLLHDPEYRETLEQVFNEDFQEQSPSAQEEPPAGTEVLDMVYERIKLQTTADTAVVKISKLHLKKWAAAAVVLITFSVGAYYWNKANDSTISNPVANNNKGEHILPGGNKAVLTLSDGSSISLNDMANGEIAQESGVQIRKTADGKLSYLTEALAKKASKIAYNTITTPKGGQYELALPDGTMVWLNAASSLKYPTSFNGKDRKVELTGEAYFEVAKNKSMPFKVKTIRQEVEVLGTHFNINAYADEQTVKTTLLEGSVKVKLDNSKTAMLKPGEQAAVMDDIEIRSVDASSAVDWKTGLFWFRDENVQSIMRQLARWYDIEVEYKGDVRNIRFGGQLSRLKNLSQVLRIMELTRSIHFEVEGKKIIVMPNQIKQQPNK